MATQSTAAVEGTPSCDVPASSSLFTYRFGKSDKQKQHEFLYWEFSGYGGQQAVRMGPWKGVRQNMLRRNNPDPLKIELYNLEDNIGATNDVAADHPEVVAKIKAVMQQQHTPSELFRIAPIDGPRGT